MIIVEILNELFYDYTLRTVAMGSILLGFVSGLLGSFAVLRRQSLLGDTLSHAVFPGILAAFILTSSRLPEILLIGAAISGGLGMICVLEITRNTILKEDTALGIILSTFFGAGVLLFTFIQRIPSSAMAGLEDYLFGQAATLLMRDVISMGVLGTVVLTVVGCFWKEFKIITFDREFAETIGLPVRQLDILLAGCTVVAVVMGLQMVGVVLMSAMLIAPAAAARQWTHRFHILAVGAGAVGAGGGLLGSVTSSQMTRLPTGPSIVTYLSVLVIVSLLFAPNRGVISQYRQRKENQLRFASETLTVHLLHHEGRIEESLESRVFTVQEHLGWDSGFTRKIIRWTTQRGLAVLHGDRLTLTTQGKEVARQVMER